MNTNKHLRWLVPLIGLLVLGAAGAGLFWPADGAPYAFVTHRGEEVMIAGRGLYRYDTVSTAAQEQAADFVTLALGLPLLAVSGWLALRRSLRGRLLLAGTLGYFLYTYMQMSMATAYNPLFLVYVALFSLSLFAFILNMLSFDLATLPAQFSDRVPRRGIATVLFAAGAFLVLAWVGGRILPTLTSETVALENMTTMVIQTMDLGLIVPLAFLAGWLLLRRSAWGYLLASVAVLKFVTLGASVTAMAINMALAGVPVGAAELIIFAGLTLVNALMAVLLLGSVQAGERPPASGRTPVQPARARG